VNEAREDRGNDGRVENEENQTQVSLPFPPPLEIATRFPHSHRPYDFCASKPSKPNKERRPRRRIASLPPSGSFFNEKMLSVLDYIYAHAAGGAFYTANGGAEIEAVQIRHLDLGDLFHLLLGDLADLVLVRFRRSFGQVHGPLD
jgi:hypothetical protein